MPGPAAARPRPRRRWCPAAARDQSGAHLLALVSGAPLFVSLDGCHQVLARLALQHKVEHILLGRGAPARGVVHRGAGGARWVGLFAGPWACTYRRRACGFESTQMHTAGDWLGWLPGPPVPSPPACSPAARHPHHVANRQVALLQHQPRPAHRLQVVVQRRRAALLALPRILLPPIHQRHHLRGAHRDRGRCCAQRRSGRAAKQAPARGAEDATGFSPASASATSPAPHPHLVLL